MAPAVSSKYWLSLSHRYAESLKSSGNAACIPHLVAGGDVDSLVQYFSDHGQLSDAVLVAQAASEGSISPPKVKGSSKEKPGHQQQQKSSSRSGAGSSSLEAEADRLTTASMSRLADFHFSHGSPTLAACCHLAVEDLQAAMSKLIRGHELELAVSVGRVLTSAPRHTDLALGLLARRCEALGRWELGLELLALQSSSSSLSSSSLPSSDINQVMLCARCSSSVTEIDALLAKAGLPSMELCAQRAASLDKNHNHDGNDDDAAAVFERVKLHLLSQHPERGLSLGLKHVKATLRRSRHGGIRDVFPLLQLLACVRVSTLLHSHQTEALHQLLALCSYAGAWVAVLRGFHPVVDCMFSTAAELVESRSLDVGVTGQDIESDRRLVRDHVTHAGHRKQTPEQNGRLYQLLEEIGGGRGEEGNGEEDWYPLEPGPIVVASSHLPSHSDVHTSWISKQRIRGAPFFLEDGRCCVSLSEALMWAAVNPFSPLGTGQRINPF